MGYRVVGEVTMAVHFAFLGYLAFGGFLAWRWPWALWPHLAAVGWGLGSVMVGLPCPLTDVEDWARRHAGQGGLPRGFIDQYLEGVVYPERYTIMVRWVMAGVIVSSWLGAFLRGRAHRRRATQLDDDRAAALADRYQADPVRGDHSHVH